MSASTEPLRWLAADTDNPHAIVADRLVRPAGDTDAGYEITPEADDLDDPRTDPCADPYPDERRVAVLVVRHADPAGRLFTETRIGEYATEQDAKDAAQRYEERRGLLAELDESLYVDCECGETYVDAGDLEEHMLAEHHGR